MRIKLNYTRPQPKPFLKVLTLLLLLHGCKSNGLICLMEAERHRDQIERGIRHGQAQGVGFEEWVAAHLWRAPRPAWDGRSPTP